MKCVSIATQLLSTDYFICYLLSLFNSDQNRATKKSLNSLSQHDTTTDIILVCFHILCLTFKVQTFDFAQKKICRVQIFHSNQEYFIINNDKLRICVWFIFFEKKIAWRLTSQESDHRICNEGSPLLMENASRFLKRVLGSCVISFYSKIKLFIFWLNKGFFYA